MRLVGIQDNMPITRVMKAMLPTPMRSPSTRVRTIRMKSVGMLSRASVMRMRTLSIQPELYPDMVPTVMPMTTLMQAASSPMRREIWPPNRVRRNMSRPTSSVPKGCSQEGALRMAWTSMRFAASSDTKRDTPKLATTMNRSTTRLAMAGRWRTKRRRKLGPQRLGGTLQGRGHSQIRHGRRVGQPGIAPGAGHE